MAQEQRRVSGTLDRERSAGGGREAARLAAAPMTLPPAHTSAPSTNSAASPAAARTCGKRRNARERRGGPRSAPTRRQAPAYALLLVTGPGG